ncbi:unnamed protein product [Trichobilharzia regenti]|uniref:Eggshell protein n=1 Tax=Trichobilharzia regenti TaxID=157069 RepID=A0A183VNL3_TRIRE|nr:unnamed protein product [Trichobilharzia regenti]VDP97948.1 unnamed protein product [Trichobilharzia regenti]
MKAECIYLCLLISLSFVLTQDYYSDYQSDYNGDNSNNYDYTYNSNDYDYNTGDGKDKSGKVITKGKFVALGKSDKGSNYHQITFFHKGSKSKKKFSNYETKGKVYSYGRQKLKAKFGIESRLKGKSKFNGIGKFNGYASDYLPTQNGYSGEGSNTAESLIPNSGSDYSPSSYDYAGYQSSEGQAPTDYQTYDYNNNNNNEGGNGQTSNDYEGEGESYNGDSGDYYKY